VPPKPSPAPWRDCPACGGWRNSSRATSSTFGRTAWTGPSAARAAARRSAKATGSTRSLPACYGLGQRLPSRSAPRSSTGLVAIAVPFIQERLRAGREAEEAREARRREALELAVKVRSVAEQATLDGYIRNTAKEHYEYLQQLGRNLAEAHDPHRALG
jgi:hypothetical protein